ncbi:MAG: SsrA-binding protein SmpB [Planctomycetes bacterium]|nr:SsrA-binding protein SmpB [Planctomycetota bacterium]
MSKAPAKASGKSPSPEERLVCDHKKARFHYEVLETYTAGLVLVGTEVKVMREGKMTLDESYARVQEGECWLIGANIPEYSHGNLQNHEPKRKRKCLLHRREIQKLQAKSQQQGLTLVPLKVWFSTKGFAKVTIGVCKGRKTHDKRQHLRDKDARREIRER